MPQLTKNFHSREFNCKDGTPVPRRDMNGLEALCRQFLEPMRKKYGRCTVHSGYRTVRHNANVGGERNSFHIYTAHDGNDQAADVSFQRGSAADWHRTAVWLRSRKRSGKGGIGRYNSFVHIDLRDYQLELEGMK